MARKPSTLFLHFRSDPNPDSFPTVWEHRQQQARSFISNPFETERSTPADETDIPELPVTDSPQAEKLDEKKVFEEPKGPDQTATGVENRNLDVVWGEQPAEWLSLFYDLAWTATFSNLTSNSSFVDIKQTATYAIFFSIMWWIWVAQVFYTIDFYTDDWFHLICIAVQFVIFGALAALTQGLDVLTYITHSPGSDTWSSPSLMEIQPEEYLARNSSGVRFQWIALVIAISRAILFILYLRVLIFAKSSSKSKRLPLRLCIVPAATFISTVLFAAAYVLINKRGEERGPAIIKLGLWVAGVLVEVAAHVLRFQWDMSDELRLKSHGSIVGRFTGLTTIIVGEGINAIANTLYNIESAPGFRSKVLLGVGAAAIIIFLLVYLYFQGPAPQKPVRRRAAWAMLHWPWLLCVILLLEAVKNQLLLTNFLHSMWYLVDQTDSIMYSNVASESQFNETFAKLLLQGGMTFVDQNQKLQELIAQNGTALNGTELSAQASTELVSVWYYRTLAQGVVNIYTSFMTNNTIDKDVQTNITRYLYHYDFTLQDYTSDATYNLRNIIWGLIEPSVYNARYIMVLSGCTFLILALLNLVQSWPRDRFQWASIISRFVVGLLVTSLVALNIGQYQTYFTPDGVADSRRASIFGWIDADGVLPTLAVAYVVQFIIDTILVYLAKYVTRMRLGVSRQLRKVMKSA